MSTKPETPNIRRSENVFPPFRYRDSSSIIGTSHKTQSLGVALAPEMKLWLRQIGLLAMLLLLRGLKWCLASNLLITALMEETSDTYGHCATCDSLKERHVEWQTILTIFSVHLLSGDHHGQVSLL
jgi:hypothetical protein